MEKIRNGQTIDTVTYTHKAFNKKKKIIIVVLLALIIVFSLILLKRNNMLNRNTEIITKHEDVEGMKLSYRVIDNTSEDIEGVVIIEDKSGIDSIEYTNDEDKLMKLNCNGELKVAIDKKIKLDTDYNIKIKTREEEENKTLRIDKSKIDEYVKINFDNDTIDIQYNNEEPVKKYYKIGNGNWVEYKNRIDVADKIYNMNVETSEIIYAKEVSENGNTIINVKEITYIPYNKNNKKDVFDIMTQEGKTMQEFGFSVVSRVNCENWGFSSHNLLAGNTYRSSYDGYYSAKFKLDFRNINLNYGGYEWLIVKTISDVGGNHPGNVGVTVYFKNGQSKTKQEVDIRYNKTIDTKFYVKDKEIDYIEINLWRTR